MTKITFGSVCSGIEAASVAWEPLGFWAEWFSEIEPFPAAVLAHHWPDVPNLGDMLKLPALVAAGEIAAPDTLVGGTPCQAFSVAGNRESLADARGGLTLAYVELADAIDRQRAREGQEPCVIVWENVPGVLSTKDNAFGCFLAGLAGEDVPLLPPGKRWTNAGLVLGPKRAVAWRILDAQYFGLAQRRRRVFVVASARDGFDPSEILFEREGVRRDTPPRQETWQESAGDAGTGAAVTSADISPVLLAKGNSSHRTDAEAYVAQPYHDVALCLNAGGMGRIDYESESMVVQHFAPTVDVCPTLRAGGNKTGGDRPPGTDVDTADSLICVSVSGDIAHTLNTANNGKGCSEDGTGRGVPTIAHTVALRGRDGGATAETRGRGRHGAAGVNAVVVTSHTF
jgi:DNA (cytosine-5)-methyltransferase 1